MSLSEIHDWRGRRYEIINSAEVKELKGDGGILAFARTDVNITINNNYTMSFGIRGKFPGLLYVNAWPAVPWILYNPVELDDGYWYGFYFEKLEYTEKEIRPGEVVPVRTMVAKVAKCRSMDP